MSPEVRAARTGAVRLGHAEVDAIGFDEAVSAIAQPASLRPSPLLVVTPNIAHISMLERDAALQDAYARAGLVLADGWPVAAAATRLGGVAVPRVTGADLLPAVLDRAATTGLAVALVGGREGAAPLAAARAVADRPGLRVVLAEGPRFPDRPAAVDAERLAAMLPPGADVVVLGLGAPKQELLVAAGLRAGVLPPAAYLCFGAAIDFLAGVVTRAPERWQRWHLEWAHRVVHEPRRLAGRYLVAAPRFAAVVVRERRAR